MKHYDIASWADYVRGVAHPGEREALESHLAEGCQACAGMVMLLTRVQQLSAQRLTVPEELVTLAKAMLPARPAVSTEADWTAILPRLAAKLVYTNLGNRAAQGVRSVVDTLVQVVYQAGDYGIEVQIEPEPEAAAIALVGQVVNRAASGEPVAGARVRLMGPKKLLSSTQSNRFGEFCVLSKMHRGLRLSIDIEAVGRRVEIPLDKLMAGFRQ
jgi:hypothetical protein